MVNSKNDEIINNRCALAHFHLRSDKPVMMPHFLGSALRGVMGHQLLQRYCVMQDAKCNCCERSKECIFPVFFNRQDEMNANNTLPNQYVIYHSGTDSPTDHIFFTIKLIGKAGKYALIAAKAIEDGCAQGIGAKRVPFFMESIIWDKMDILNPEKRVIAPDARQTATKSMENVTLIFDTPLQIRTHQEGVAWKLDFELLMRNIFRRLEMLDVLQMPKEEAEKLMALASTVKTEENRLRPYRMMRYSNHTKEKKSLSGLTGKISFSGELSVFMPYLRAGALIHVGKACTMGMGHYEIQEMTVPRAGKGVDGYIQYGGMPFLSSETISETQTF